MKVARPLLALAALGAGCVAPAPGVPAFTPTGPARPETTETRVLPSGLRLIVDRDPLSRVVVVASAVDAGASADPPGKGGLAHLVEHLTFRGVDARSGPTPLWQRLNRLPMTPPFLAATSWDQMLFRSMAPAGAWRELLAIEAGRLAEPLRGVDEKAVELERMITEDQAQMSDDDAEVGSWRDLLGDDVTPDESSVDDTSGSAASRATLTLADARAFAGERFRPGGMTLVIAGRLGADDATLDDIVAMLPPALVDAPTPGTPSRPPAPARPARPTPVPSPAIAYVPVPTLDRPTLLLTWRVPSLLSADGPALRWMARLLGDVLDADVLRRSDARIASTGVHLRGSARGGLLVAEIELTSAANPGTITQLVEDRVLRFARWPEPEHGRFEALRLRLATSMAIEDDAPVEHALSAAALSNVYGRIVSPARIDATVTAVTWDQVVGETWRCLAFPPHRSLRVPAPTAAQGTPAAASTQEPPDLLADAAGWDTGSLRQLMSRPELGKAQAYALPNGTTLVFLRRPGPEAVAWLGYRGGLSSGASPALVGLAASHRPRYGDHAARLGLVTGGDADTDTTFDTVTFRPQQLQTALDFLVSRARAGVANWPAPDDFRRAIAVEHRDDEPSMTAARILWRNLYAQHPYARTYTVGDAWRVTLPAAAQWVNEIVRPGNAALVVVGDLEPEAIIQASQRATSDWTRPGGRAAAPLPAPRLRRASTGPRTAIVDDRGRRMVTLHLGCLLPTDAPGRAGRLVLSRAVGERMDNDLRHASGYTQGASVRVGEPRGSTHLTISTSIEPAHLGAALATIHRHWVRWGSTGFDAGETNAGRWAVVGLMAAHLESANQVARVLFNEWNQDHPFSLGDQLPAQVLNVTPADLTSAFATCRDNAALVIRGDRAAIEPVVRSIWPEVEPSL